MTPANILIAAGIFPPAIGGPATHLAQIIPTLLGRGHRLRAIALGGDAGQTEDPCPVLRISGPHWTVRSARYRAAYRRHARWADVVYATSMALPRTRASRPVLLRVPGDIAWERAVNRGLVPRTEDIDAFQHRSHGLRVRMLTGMRRREARAADRIVVPSAYLKGMVEGWGVDPARIVVVPSVTARRNSTAPARDDARRDLGMRDGTVHLVAPARLVPWKGLDLLIDALQAVPNASLTVLGDGPDRTPLANRARPVTGRVHFLGDCGPDLVAQHLAAADYCVVYSGYEGLSHAILESLAAGTPVIASRRGGNPEVIADGVNGLLVDHPNVAALVDALRIAAQPSTLARLRAGAAAPLPYFDPDRAADAIATELEALSRR